MRTQLLATPLAAGIASAHVVMNTPIPYGLNTVPLLQVNPLDGETYRFPCQYGSDASAYPKAEATTALTAGSTTLLNFTGTAVHAGGSCQLSVTYDWPPPADKSKWKVIHSIIGGCPATAVGNLVDAAANTDEHGRFYPPKYCDGATGTECLKQYDIPVPKQLKNGKATLAWTWLNKLGNREFYMNCAPVTISGGSEDDIFTNGLPDMFVANIPGECTTGEGVPEFPDPGESVEISQAEGDAVSKGALGACNTGSGSGASKGTPASGTASGSVGSKTATSKPASGAASATSVTDLLYSPTPTASKVADAHPSMNSLGVFPPGAVQPSSIAEPAVPAATEPAASSSLSYSSTTTMTVWAGLTGPLPTGTVSPIATDAPPAANLPQAPASAPAALVPITPQPTDSAIPPPPHPAPSADPVLQSTLSPESPSGYAAPASLPPKPCIPCTGALVCLSPTSFALCDGQGCAAASMGVAAGTQCVGGEIVAAAGKTRRGGVKSLMERQREGRMGVKI
ncbi:hypothetical protein LTS18_008784, partial [Coniosporium uncinatum]